MFGRRTLDTGPATPTKAADRPNSAPASGRGEPPGAAPAAPPRRPVVAGKSPVAAALRAVTERICGPSIGTAAVDRSRMWKRLLKKA